MRTAAVADASEPPRVAFAVGRTFGNAVTRNRVRRRLRAAVREHAALLEPGHAYLWRVTPRVRKATYTELSDALRETLVRTREGAAE
jgi:ribonuclease P protein component